MTKDEMKNKISMALKDPALQQGFEIICKDLAISEHGREHNDYELAEVYKQVKELKEENAELEKELEQAKKVQVVEHFEAYGQCRDSRRIASLETENAELKDKLNNLSKVAEVRLANWQKLEEENKELKAQNNKAKEIVRSLYFIIQARIDYENNIAIADEMWRAKQFWKECEEW